MESTRIESAVEIEILSPLGIESVDEMDGNKKIRWPMFESIIQWGIWREGMGYEMQIQLQSQKRKLLILWTKHGAAKKCRYPSNKLSAQSVGITPGQGTPGLRQAWGSQNVLTNVAYSSPGPCVTWVGQSVVGLIGNNELQEKNETTQRPFEVQEFGAGQIRSPKTSSTWAWMGLVCRIIGLMGQIDKKETVQMTTTNVKGDAEKIPPRGKQAEPLGGMTTIPHTPGGYGKVPPPSLSPLMPSPNERQGGTWWDTKSPTSSTSSL